MDFSDHSPLSIKDPNSWKVQIIEKEIDEWDYFNYRLEKTMIQIEFTQEHQIIYSKNGNVLRMEDEFNTFKVQELFNTIEQIKYLTYQVQNNQKKEIGKRITFWDKKVLENVGGYYEYGQKIGLWKELIENYWSHAQVFLTGEYYKGLKTGIWSYKYNNLKIGSGRYNQQGKKFGKWIDLDGFWDQSQIKYKGEYNMSGVKVGRWDIMYCKNGDDKYKQMNNI